MHITRYTYILIDFVMDDSYIFAYCLFSKFPFKFPF